MIYDMTQNIGKKMTMVEDIRDILILMIVPLILQVGFNKIDTLLNHDNGHYCIKIIAW